jgi:hypothetical protein
MDKDFTSGSLTGSVLLASPYWALCCEHAERFAPRRPTCPAISPEVCLPPAGQRESLADTADPPTSAALRLPAHPTLERSVGISRTRRGVADMPAVSLAAGFRQARAATGHPPGHRPRRSIGR